MRTRKQLGTTHHVTSTGASRVRSTGQVSYGSPVPWDYLDSYEAICDETGRKSVVGLGGRLAMRPCHHIRWSMTAEEGLTAWMQYTNTLDLQTNAATCVIYFASPVGLTPVEDFCLSNISAVTPSPQGSLKDQWENCKPTLSTRANLSVFLYELREISQLWNFIPSRHFSFRSWRDVLRYANGHHLNLNFGWKPFASDVRKTFTAMQEYEKRYFDYVAEQNKDLVRHSRAVAPGGDFEEEFFFPPPWDSWKYKLTGSAQRTDVSTFHYSYVSPHSTEGPNWRSLLDSLGLHVNPANIWAVLPWSFVVDWFVDVGGYLESFSQDWMEPEVSMYQACYSTKIEMTFDVAVKYASYPSNPWSKACTFVYSSFSRNLGLGSLSFQPTELGADRIRLLSSLLLSRVL